MTIRHRPVLALACAVALGCSSAPIPPEPRDPELVTLAENGRLALRAGSPAKAEAYFRRALDRARAMDDAELIGSQAYNLAIPLVEAGRYEEAEILLDEAAAEERRRGADPTEPILALAKLAYRRGDRLRAAQQADRIVRAEGIRPGTAPRFEAQILRARIAIDEGDPAAARAALAAAERLAGDPPSPHRRAAIAGVLGRILLAQGKPAEAAAAFDREADALREAGRFPEMAAAIERAGEAYRGAEDHRAAAERLYRAGRALAGQERIEPALAVLERAIEEAQRAGETKLGIRAASLRKELEGR